VNHALDALGLDQSADERAVRQAYAKRLRTTRPDDDPAGYQKLRETYDAALAYVRWREKHADDDESGPDTGIAGETPPEVIAGQAATRRAPEHVNLTVDAVTPDETFVARPFEVDVDQVMGDALAFAAGRPEADLGAWFEKVTVDWPLSAKPAVAPFILEYILNTELDITPAQLDAVVSAFGLDDVLTALDPLGLQQLRGRVATRQEERELAGRAGPVPQPGRGADWRAKWQEYRWPVRIAALILLFAIPYHFNRMDSIARKQNSGPAALQSDVAMREARAMFLNHKARKEIPSEAIGTYAQIIRDIVTTDSALLERIVALAYYNRAILLSDAGQVDQSRSSYETLAQRFSRSADPEVRFQVARGLFNLGNLHFFGGRLEDALAVYIQVMSSYEDSADERLRVQAAKGSLNRIVALRDLGRMAAARRSLGQMLERYGEDRNPEIAGFVHHARQLGIPPETPEGPPEKP
jgi:hypothetical protein